MCGLKLRSWAAAALVLALCVPALSAHRDDRALRDQVLQLESSVLFILPGLQYVTKRWIVEAGIQVPVVQDLGGTALEKDYIVRTGFRLNF